MARNDTILRNIAIAAGLIGTAFWIYTFYAIAQVPPGDHSGFQWLGEMPLTLIFLLLTMPGLGLALSRRRLVIAALLTLGALIAFASVWRQLLGEFAGYK